MRYLKVAVLLTTAVVAGVLMNLPLNSNMVKEFRRPNIKSIKIQPVLTDSNTNENITALTITAFTDQKLDISKLSSEDKNTIYNLYKNDGWKLSQDNNELIKLMSSEGMPILVNGKIFNIGVSKSVVVNVPSNTNAIIEYPNMSNDNISFTQQQVKINSSNTQTVSIINNLDINKVVGIMDNNSETLAQSNIDNTYSNYTMSQLNFNINSQKATYSLLGYSTGQKVDCNDFNGPYTNGKSYPGEMNDFTNLQKWINFYQSDCYYASNGTKAYYFQHCIRDTTNNPYCTKGSGNCSALQRMPRTYHHMNIWGQVSK